MIHGSCGGLNEKVLVKWSLTVVKWSLTVC